MRRRLGIGCRHKPRIPARWLPVHQPLPFRPVDSSNHPLAIGHVPMLPAEGEFVQVADDMLLEEATISLATSSSHSSGTSRKTKGRKTKGSGLSGLKAR